MVAAEQLVVPPKQSYSHRLTENELEMISVCFSQLPEGVWFANLVLPTRTLSAAEVFFQYSDAIIQHLRDFGQPESIKYDFDSPMFCIVRPRTLE